MNSDILLLISVLLAVFTVGYIHTKGLANILRRGSAVLWALAGSVDAAKSRYRADYRAAVAQMEAR